MSSLQLMIFVTTTKSPNYKISFRISHCWSSEAKYDPFLMNKKTLSYSAATLQATITADEYKECQGTVKS